MRLYWRADSRLRDFSALKYFPVVVNAGGQLAASPSPWPPSEQDESSTVAPLSQEDMVLSPKPTNQPTVVNYARLHFLHLIWLCFGLNMRQLCVDIRISLIRYWGNCPSLPLDNACVLLPLWQAYDRFYGGFGLRTSWVGQDQWLRSCWIFIGCISAWRCCLVWWALSPLLRKCTRSYAKGRGTL